MSVIPYGDWLPCDSTAIEAFRFLPEPSLLQVVYADGRLVYDYPCPPPMYERFVDARSKGRFLNEVLKPYAEGQGWDPPAVPLDEVLGRAPGTGWPVRQDALSNLGSRRTDSLVLLQLLAADGAGAAMLRAFGIDESAARALAGSDPAT